MMEGLNMRFSFFRIACLSLLKGGALLFLAGGISWAAPVVTRLTPPSAGFSQGQSGPFGQNHEFVAADSGDGIDLTDTGAQAMSHLFQHGVAGVMALGIIDRLKVIEVNE